MTNLSIEIYAMLDEIRKEHGIREYKQWAQASGMHQPRLPELNRMLKRHRQGLPSEPGRAFTANKCNHLIGGLVKLLGGGGVVKKEILRKIGKSRDPAEIRILKQLLLSEQQQQAVDAMVDAFLLPYDEGRLPINE